MKINLNGKWKFRNVTDVSWFDATVPGCNYLDLMDCGLLADPFVGLNEKNSYYVAETDWEYKKTLELTAEDLDHQEVYLRCDMLDTLCDVFVNETKIAYTENCHIRYSFEIKKYLKAGENTFRFVFRSPVNYVRDIAKNQMVPPNANGQNGVCFVRKPQCHFGWDWGPVLPPSGIQGDIYLEGIDIAEVQEVVATQKHYDGKVDVDVKALIRKLGNNDTTCVLTLTHPDGSVQKIDGDKGIFTVENPELWWTYELSGKDKQPLYVVKAEVYADGKLIAEKEISIGLRTLYLDRSRDKWGLNFQFVLNGVPIFAKGGNYIPSDSFITRFTDDKLRAMLEAARFSNFNIIRVWGGGYYESDAFYNMCDEMGILVWQDFAFACMPYPFFEEAFLANVKNEIECNVKRLRHHASLALWSGNNEIETMSGGWMNMRKYIKWTEIFFYQILEKEIRKYDTVTSFIPGSPCGSAYGEGINSDNVGDTHLWSVWHGMASMKEYRNRMTRFCSEFGFESLPDIKSIRLFAEEKDYSLTSEVFTNHQKCGSGNDKMFYYIRSRFKLPQNFEDFIYLSQVTQMECISDATEHWRRNKGRCNGAIYWQFNDCWPVCSWSSIDYYGNYKALQYSAKHFNAPLSVSVEDTKDYIRLHVLNDLNEKQDVTVRYDIFDFSKGIIKTEEKKITVDAVANAEGFTLWLVELKKKYGLKKTGILARLYKDGEEISRKTYLFDVEKNLMMPKTKITKEISADDKIITVKVTADKFARIVCVSSDVSLEHFSDNYFDLLPGESKVVTIPLNKDIDTQKQIDAISVVSLTDIPTRKITNAERISTFKMMVSPTNIGNCVFHRSVPKDVVLD
jgi:beta-mannosidase